MQIASRNEDTKAYLDSYLNLQLLNSEKVQTPNFGHPYLCQWTMETRHKTCYTFFLLPGLGPN